MSLKLSYNTWAYSSYPSWLPAYTLEETIKRLAAIGYDGIEIGAAGPHAYPPTLSERRRVEIKKVLDGEGITLSSMLPAPSGGPVNNVSSPVEEERAYTTQHYKDLIDLTAQWGGKTVIYIPGWIVFGTTRAQALEWSQQALAELADYAAPQGIQLVIEPTCTRWARTCGTSTCPRSVGFHRVTANVTSRRSCRRSRTSSSTDMSPWRSASIAATLSRTGLPAKPSRTSSHSPRREE